MNFSQEDFEAALGALRRGGVILYPTDTVWGLGCDATLDAAVARVFAIKRRADSKAMLSLVDGWGMLGRYVGASAIEEASGLIDPARPTTVIYPAVHGIARALVADDGSAGFRICGAEFARWLCKELGRPIVSTSANISGHAAPATFAEISPEIIDAVDYAVVYGRTDGTAARPSRIVKLNPDGGVAVIRP